MSWLAKSHDHEDGLTLIEVVVSLMIFAFLIAGTSALTLSGIRGLAVSRMDTVGKNLTQERLEKMRNLPFFVSATITGGSPDLFDKYYVNTTSAAASTSSSGFVSSAAARDTANGDPASGPFYRIICQQPVPPATTTPCNIAGGDTRFAEYTQRVTVQLLNADGTPIANPSFDSTSTGTAGLQPTAIVGVTITTLWKATNVQKKYSVYSKITDTSSKAPVVTLQARVSAFRFTGQLPQQRSLLLEAGVLDLNGSLSSSTAASAVATGVHTTIDSTSSQSGASDVIAAPPTATNASKTGSAFQTQDSLMSNADVADVGGSIVSNVGASTLNGNPSTGTPGAPVTATLFGGGNGSGGGNYALTADSEPANARLRLAGPVAQLYTLGCNGSCSAVSGSGYLASTSGATHSATANVKASFISGTVLKLFPTQFAPDGVVQVLPTNVTGQPTATFSLTCTSNAASSPPASATAAYAATVKYWQWNALTSTGSYQSITVNQGTAADPLANPSLLSTQVGVDPNGQPLYLSDYLQSWSSLTSPGMTTATKVTTSGTSVSTTFPGFLAIQSVPLRTTDPDSTFGVQIGAATCTAGDLR
jgi:Tfp pilus assembly protein PilV